MPDLFRFIFWAVALASVTTAQPAKGPILVPSEPLDELARQREVRAHRQPEPAPAHRLEIVPPGDALYVVEQDEWDGRQWQTYRRPKVDLFSRDSAGLAVQGYDVVSYQEGKAERGTKDYVVELAGVTWRFTTRDHLRQFTAEPDRYLPAYGGFCAYSVSRGYPVTADPKSFAVRRGKLYLLFDPAVKLVWEQNERSFAEKADRYWPQLHR